MKDIDQKLSTLKARVETLENDYKRALADYQNLEKRIFQTSVIEKSRLIARFLPLLDDLERAHKHTSDKGLELIIKQFYKTLSDLDVSRITSKPGMDFSPLSMECVETVTGEKGKVVEVLQQGYRLGESMVLRPAKVTVGLGSQSN